MNRATLKISAATALVTFALIVSATPVAAAIFRGEGYYSRFSFGTDGGIVIVDRVEGNKGRLNALLVGLPPNTEFFVSGRSIGCDGTPSASNREWRLSRTADANGTILIKNHELSHVHISSVWVGRPDFIPQCSMTTAFDSIDPTVVDDWDGDGVMFAIHESGHHMLGILEQQPSGQELLLLVYSGFEGGGEYRLTGFDKQCGKRPTNKLWYLFEVADGSSYVEVNYEIPQEALDSLRSFKLRNTTAGTLVDCVRANIIVGLNG